MAHSRDQDERRARRQALREAGFTPREADRLRDSKIRAEAALRARKQTRPVQEARFIANRPIGELRDERRRREAQQAYKRYQTYRPTTDAAQRERWQNAFKEGGRVPKSWRTIQKDFENRLRTQGIEAEEAEELAWGLTFESIMKRTFTPRTMTQDDIAAYLAERGR